MSQNLNSFYQTKKLLHKKKIYEMATDKHLKIEGIITSISKTHYCQIKTTDGQTVFFNKHTKISGCKFEYMREGDRVLVCKTSNLAHNRTKKKFASHIELVDIETKWNKILESDKKYSIIKDQYSDVIMPEIIRPNRQRLGVDYDLVNEFIRVYKFDNNQELEVFTKFAEGGTIRKIAKDMGVNRQYVFRTIKKYLKIMEDFYG